MVSKYVIAFLFFLSVGTAEGEVLPGSFTIVRNLFNGGTGSDLFESANREAQSRCNQIGQAAKHLNTFSSRREDRSTGDFYYRYTFEFRCVGFGNTNQLL